MLKIYKIIFSKKSKEGGVAIALLLVAFSILGVTASYVKYSLNNATMTRHVMDVEQARMFGESALDAAESQLRISIENRALGLSGGGTLLDDLDSLVPPDFQNNKYDVSIFSAQDFTGAGGMVETNIDGAVKEYMDLLITTGVSNTTTGVTAAFQEIVRITREPFLRYAIFFDELLELHPGPLMVVNGDMRSNSDIELWAGSGLWIDGTIRAPGKLDIFKSDRNDGYSTDARRLAVSKKIKVFVNRVGEKFYQDGEVLDSRNSAWDAKSKTVWSGRVSVGNQVGRLKPPVGENVDNHALIEPPDDDDSDKLSKAKLANKADLYIKIKTDGTVKVKTSTSGGFKKVENFAVPGAKDANGVYDVTGGWINVHSDFFDPRESEYAYEHRPSPSHLQRMEMVDIYMDKLLEKYPNHKIIYVKVADPDDDRKKPAVRLRNGNDLSKASSSAGISVATHRSMYIEGNYNTKNPVPALIAADNLTILSNGWSDWKSTSMKPRGATDTDLHAAVMIGYADPDNPDGKITGGAHNLVRFRENWSRHNYNFTGSYISLWTASDSHALLSGQCYSPPRRNITYDESFKTTQPPGMPIGYTTPEVLVWKELSWNEALGFQ